MQEDEEGRADLGSKRKLSISCPDLDSEEPTSSSPFSTIANRHAKLSRVAFTPTNSRIFSSSTETPSCVLVSKSSAEFPTPSPRFLINTSCHQQSFQLQHGHLNSPSVSISISATPRNQSSRHANRERELPNQRIWELDPDLAKLACINCLEVLRAYGISKIRNEVEEEKSLSLEDGDMEARSTESTVKRKMIFSPPNARTLQKDFRIIRQVGSGTFGEVYKAFDIDNKIFVALKKIHLLVEMEGFPITALREIKLLKKLFHIQNIVQLREVVPASYGIKDSCLNSSSSYMVSEYMDYDLTGILENRAVTLDLPQVKCLMKQLLTGIDEIHLNKVMHRDIKAANLLMSKDGSLKIGDWGLARSWTNKANAKYTTRVVTLWYRAPELLLGFRNYDVKIDIWAVGCIFAELMGRKCILPGKDEADQLNLIFELCGTPAEEDWPQYFHKSGPNSPKFPRKERTLEKRLSAFMPADALDLITKMLTLDPNKRINAEKALDHDFFWKGDIVDTKEAFSEKIKNQIGEDRFLRGMHEFELREIVKKAQYQPVLTNQTQQPHSNSTSRAQFKPVPLPRGLPNRSDDDRHHGSGFRGRSRGRGRGRGHARGRGHSNYRGGSNSRSRTGSFVATAPDGKTTSGPFKNYNNAIS